MRAGDRAAEAARATQTAAAPTTTAAATTTTDRPTPPPSRRRPTTTRRRRRRPSRRADDDEPGPPEAEGRRGRARQAEPRRGRLVPAAAADPRRARDPARRRGRRRDDLAPHDRDGADTGRRAAAAPAEQSPNNVRTSDADRRRARLVAGWAVGARLVYGASPSWACSLRLRRVLRRAARRRGAVLEARDARLGRRRHGRQDVSDRLLLAGDRATATPDLSCTRARATTSAARCSARSPSGAGAQAGRPGTIAPAAGATTATRFRCRCSMLGGARDPARRGRAAAGIVWRRAGAARAPADRGSGVGRRDLATLRGRNRLEAGRCFRVPSDAPPRLPGSPARRRRPRLERTIERREERKMASVEQERGRDQHRRAREHRRPTRTPASPFAATSRSPGRDPFDEIDWETRDALHPRQGQARVRPEGRRVPQVLVADGDEHRRPEVLPRPHVLARARALGASR